MNKKGFTLVELLAVIVILSLLMIIVIPSSISIGNKIKQKLLTEKLNHAEKAAVLWAQDNKRCFTTTDCYPLTSICYDDDDKLICVITIETLAEESYFSYDDGNKIINPLDQNKCLNNYEIHISYNQKNKTFSTSIVDRTSTCP